MSDARAALKLKSLQRRIEAYDRALATFRATREKYVAEHGEEYHGLETVDRQLQRYEEMLEGAKKSFIDAGGDLSQLAAPASAAPASAAEGRPLDHVLCSVTFKANHFLLQRLQQRKNCRN